MDGGLRIEGLAEFRRDLRRAHKDLPKSIQRAFKSIAEDASKKVQAGFRARGPIGAKAAEGVRPRATSRTAKIALLGTNPVIRGVNYGARVHPVFGRRMPQESFSRRVFPPWVGNQHTGPQANFGKGYVAEPILNAYTDTIATETIATEIMKAMKTAFPG